MNSRTFNFLVYNGRSRVFCSSFSPFIGAASMQIIATTQTPKIVLADAPTVNLTGFGDQFILLMTSAVGATRNILISPGTSTVPITIELVQPVSGGPCTINWILFVSGYPPFTGWQNSIPPTLTTTPGHGDLVSFYPGNYGAIGMLVVHDYPTNLS